MPEELRARELLLLVCVHVYLNTKPLHAINHSIIYTFLCFDDCLSQGLAYLDKQGVYCYQKRPCRSSILLAINITVLFKYLLLALLQLIML